MFWLRLLIKKLNKLHGRALRLISKDHDVTFLHLKIHIKNIRYLSVQSF